MVQGNDETRALTKISPASTCANPPGQVTTSRGRLAAAQDAACRRPSASRFIRQQEAIEEALTNLMNDAKGG